MTAADRQRRHRTRLKRRGIVTVTITVPKLKVAELRRLAADWRQRHAENRL